MTAYLTPLGTDERVLLDTKKAKLDYEGAIYELTGATVAIYEATWQILPGMQGDVPCRILVVTDPFTGLRIELPFEPEKADRIALSFSDNGDERRFKKVRKLLGIREQG